MKRRWTHNLGLKIAALISAAIMWMIVTNVNDPLDTRSYENIPVRILNAQIIEESNRVFEVLDNTDVIERVTVRAPRSVINEIGYADILATADINDISSLDTIAIELAVQNVTASDINDIQGSSNILRLHIEERRTRTMPIIADIEGEITEGYVMGDIVVDPNSVTISGPDSLIRAVMQATASVDITGFTSDIRATAPVLLYNDNGARIYSDRISQSVGTVAIRIPIHEVRSVPIRYEISGTPAAGYLLNGNVETSRDRIDVAGPSASIRNLSEIVIPSEVLDVSGRTDSLAVSIDINHYLPAFARLVNPEESIVRVFVGIEPEATMSITLDEEQLRVINLPSGFTLTFSDSEEIAAFNLVGLQSDLNQIDEEAIIGIVNVGAFMTNRGMTEMVDGYYRIPVAIDLGDLTDAITITNTVDVLVSIRENEGH